MNEIKILGNTPYDQITGTFSGKGNLYSFIIKGSVGQTALVEASIDQKTWVKLFDVTLAEAVESTVLQHTFPYLKITGTAQVQVARG